MIHPSSVAVSREHRRAKTDRLDTELLKRGFLGWLRGERGHCSMARVPTTAEEDAKHAMILLDDATPKPDGIFGKDRGAGDGGSNRTSGDVAVVGSHDLSARTAGGSAGLITVSRPHGRGLPETPFFPRPSELGPAGANDCLLEQAFGGLDRESLTFLEVWRTTAA